MLLSAYIQLFNAGNRRGSVEVQTKALSEQYDCDIRFVDGYVWFVKNRSQE